jgi:structure-specific endonuclease subunit SLX1
MELVSDHVCYILKSRDYDKIYIGYTVNFARRLRQHNGELVGGAKKTNQHRPWYTICIIYGFMELSSALRFEFRLQHVGRSRGDKVAFILSKLAEIIARGDGAMAWPRLMIDWHGTYPFINHPNVMNRYVMGLVQPR